VGLLNTYFVGNDSDAENFSNAEVDKFPATFQAKGLTTLELAELWAVLSEIEFSAELAGLFENIKQTDSEWIDRFPDEFTEVLADLEDDEVNELALTWIEYEELRIRNYQLADAVFIFDGLRRLAKVAKAMSANLYLWLSL
jgi:hypothetical protein